MLGDFYILGDVCMLNGVYVGRCVFYLKSKQDIGIMQFIQSIKLTRQNMRCVQ